VAESVPETWPTRELPILRAALRRIDAGQVADLEEIRAELAMDGNVMFAAVTALENAGYVDASLTMGWTDSKASGAITRVHERARRELGAWPSGEGVEIPSAYLETNLIIGIVKGDLPLAEMSALQGLLRLRKAGAIQLFTSHVAKQELEGGSPQ
jgi:hypothetical protein